MKDRTISVPLTRAAQAALRSGTVVVVTVKPSQPSPSPLIPSVRGGYRIFLKR